MTRAAARRLVVQPLAAAAFAPFGTVLVVPPGQRGRAINGGTAQRFDLVDDLALSADGGRAQLALFRAEPRRFPFTATELECHRLGTQTFVPLTGARYVLLAAPPGLRPDESRLAAFFSDGRQGVTLARGAWHHALLAMDAGDFLVIERAGSVPDCDVAPLAAPVCVALD